MCLPLWEAKELAEMNDLDGRRLQIVTQMIAVQLMASCFTLPQNAKT